MNDSIKSEDCVLWRIILLVFYLTLKCLFQRVYLFVFFFECICFKADSLPSESPGKTLFKVRKR